MRRRWLHVIHTWLCRRLQLSPLCHVCFLVDVVDKLCFYYFCTLSQQLNSLLCFVIWISSSPSLFLHFIQIMKKIKLVVIIDLWHIYIHYYNLYLLHFLKVVYTINSIMHVTQTDFFLKV